MANLRISEFDANTTLNGSEIVLGVQAGNTTKISMNDIKDFILLGNNMAYTSSDLECTDVYPTTTTLELNLSDGIVYYVDGVLLLTGDSAGITLEYTGIEFATGIVLSLSDGSTIVATPNTQNIITLLPALAKTPVKISGMFGAMTAGILRIVIEKDTPGGNNTTLSQASILTLVPYYDFAGP